MDVTDQASVLHDKGYLYISADLAFLNYLDAFYIGSYNTTRDEAANYMQEVQTGCSDLTAPQLTLDNYEYVIGAELRQGWANYTINSTISGFNATGATRDDIVSSMYSVGQAKAWCGASSFLYGYRYGGSGCAGHLLAVARAACRPEDKQGRAVSGNVPHPRQEGIQGGQLPGGDNRR